MSDLHVGLRVSDDYVLSVFDKVAALQPDIVVMTGDFMSHHPRVYDQMRRVYARFPKGRLATVGILGNHDYGPNWSHADLAQGVVDTVSLPRHHRASQRALRRGGVADSPASTICGPRDSSPARRSIASIAGGRRSRSATIPIPSTCRCGTDSRAGFCPATRMVDSASRRSCRRRSCQCAIAAIRQESSR